MGVQYNDLPPEVKAKVGKKICSESGQSLEVQRRGIMLALKWLKVR